MNVSTQDQLEVLTACFTQPELGVYELAVRFPDLPIIVIAETYRLARKNEGKDGDESAD